MMTVGYGKKLRQTMRNIQISRKTRKKCPSCSRIALKYISLGRWECSKCSTRYASRAYGFKKA